MAVLPAAQGQGIGARLLALAEDRARALDVPEIQLFTDAAMTENLAHYWRHRYAETHRAHQDGFHRVFFRKRLDTSPPESLHERRCRMTSVRWLEDGRNGYGDVHGGRHAQFPASAGSETDLTVMLERTRDELPAIQELWPRFERLVGLRGRRMHAMITAKTYAACTPVKDSDNPAGLGLSTATLPGGWYLQARITGDPPGLYERIGPAMQAPEKLAAPADPVPSSSTTAGAT